MSNLLHRIARLNIDRTKGAAPHKPLLLLCLLEIAAEGGLTTEIMPVTGELATAAVLLTNLTQTQ